MIYYHIFFKQDSFKIKNKGQKHIHTTSIFNNAGFYVNKLIKVSHQVRLENLYISFLLLDFNFFYFSIFIVRLSVHKGQILSLIQAFYNCPIDFILGMVGYFCSNSKVRFRKHSNSTIVVYLQKVDLKHFLYSYYKKVECYKQSISKMQECP